MPFFCVLSGKSTKTSGQSRSDLDEDETTAVREKIDLLSLKSFRPRLALVDQAPHSHSGETIHVHQNL